MSPIAPSGEGWATCSRGTRLGGATRVKHMPRRHAADTPRAYLSGPGRGSVCSTVSRDTARVSAT